MIVYHGSYMEVKNPDIEFSRDNVDFGKGFYVTPLREQAIKWASRFARQGKKGVVTSYELEYETCIEQYRVLEFQTYSREWLDYITSCRRRVQHEKYDIVIGGVANDKVFNTIELYFDGLIAQEEAIKRLHYEKPNLQICLSNQEMVQQHLKYIGSEVC